MKMFELTQDWTRSGLKSALGARFGEPGSLGAKWVNFGSLGENGSPGENG